MGTTYSNVLITGAAGFIGSNLAYYLAKERPQWKLTLLDSLTYAGNLINVEPLLDKSNVKFVKTDITAAADIESLFASEKFDLVFHLAAESHVDRSIHSAAEFVQTNVIGTQNLITSARAHEVKRFMHISTDEVYGTLGATGRFTETTPLDPTSPYSASKAASDLMVLASFKTHGFPAIVTRCTNNYGPYQFPEKLIPLFITNAMTDKQLPVYGDGMQIRHWIYVSDHCSGLLAAAEKGKIGEVYNFGGPYDSEIPNLQVTKAIIELLGKDQSLIKYVSDRLAHDRRYAVALEKSQQELGWIPQIGFAEGLKLTVSWYQENVSWWQEIKSGEYLKFYQKHYGQI